MRIKSNTSLSCDGEEISNLCWGAVFNPEWHAQTWDVMGCGINDSLRGEFLIDELKLDLCL